MCATVYKGYMIGPRHMSIFIMYTHVYTTEEQRQKGLLVGVLAKCLVVSRCCLSGSRIQCPRSYLHAHFPEVASRKPIGHFKHKKIVFFYGKGSHVNQAALKLAVQ